MRVLEVCASMKELLSPIKHLSCLMGKQISVIIVNIISSIPLRQFASGVEACTRKLWNFPLDSLTAHGSDGLERSA